MVDSTSGDDPLVVLIHGLGANRVVMWPFAYRLRAEGFRVSQWSYSSLFTKIESHADRLRDFLVTSLSKEARVHVVAHSMGSIVTRAALRRTRIPNLGRIVLLAPPNGGSPVARIASRFIGAVVTPTDELSDHPDSYVRQLIGPSDVEVGIIAARYDVLIPSTNTHLAGERAHETVSATHGGLLVSRMACSMTANFLRTGSLK